MNEPNLNDPGDYKELSWSELHRMKDYREIRQEHRSYAEAEIGRRKIKLTIIGIVVAVIAVIVTAIPFIVNCIKKTS